MTVYIVYEYAVIEYEERFRLMSVHSSEDKAKEVIEQYAEIASNWKDKHEYQYEEYNVDRSYYNEE